VLVILILFNAYKQYLKKLNDKLSSKLFSKDSDAWNEIK
jgi:hypothetical protein